MEYGLVKRVESDISVHDLPEDYTIYEAHGRQLTAGIVDMHSHSTVDTLPFLRGWSDDNELSNDITPYVRSLDGIKDSYGYDSAASIVRYFLSNASSWRGDVAKRVKAELKAMLAAK